MKPKFDLQFVELKPEVEACVGKLTINSVEARHTRDTNPLALRVGIDGLNIAYTGDGELTDRLTGLVEDVDLLIAECYFYDKPVNWHLNYQDIAALNARRTVLTHMHENMLSHVDDVAEECATDGYRVVL